MHNTFLRQLLDTGFQCTMNPDSVRIENSDFWYNMRGKINELDDSEFNFAKIRNEVWKFWNARRNKRIKVDETKFDPTPKLASAFNAQNNHKKCEVCDKYRKKISRSHTTDKCFFGDQPGFEKKIGNLVEESQIKSLQHILDFLFSPATVQVQCMIQDVHLTVILEISQIISYQWEDLLQLLIMKE